MGCSSIGGGEGGMVLGGGMLKAVY